MGLSWSWFLDWWWQWSRLGNCWGIWGGWWNTISKLKKKKKMEISIFVFNNIIVSFKIKNAYAEWAACSFANCSAASLFFSASCFSFSKRSFSLMKESTASCKFFWCCSTSGISTTNAGPFLYSVVFTVFPLEIWR